MENVWLPLLSALGAVAAAAASPILIEAVRSRIRASSERARKLALLALLRAEFGHVARHSATNLKRLTENFRAPPTINEFAIAIKKISLRQTDIEARNALFSAVKVEDLALLPENLAREAMRIQLRTRNVEIDIESTLEQLNKIDAEKTYDPRQMESAEHRLRSLSNTVERCAQDSAAIVENLRKYELTLMQSGLLWHTSQFFAAVASTLGLRFLWRRINSAFAKVLRLERHRYQDDPIHFDDVLNLREVGDWKSWKEEQTLVSSDDILKVFRENFAQYSADKPLYLRSQSVGTINLISHVDSEEGSYCVRTRINEPIFQYEKRLVKDAVIALCLKETIDEDADHTQLLSNCVRAVANKPKSQHAAIDFELGPNIYFFSNNHKLSDGRRLPVTITDWIDHPMLGEQLSAEGLKCVGAAIARLHMINIGKFYRNFRDLGTYRFARNFSAEVVSEIDIRLVELPSGLRSSATKALGVFQSALREAAQTDRFSICHNDLHVNNIFLSPDGAVDIIDWDNACVHHRYFDFVKIKYWGDIGADGRFQENDQFFSAFCEGYGVDAKKVLTSPVFKALSTLWLLRVYAFEKKREAVGQVIPAPFLASAYYLDKLKETTAI